MWIGFVIRTVGADDHLVGSHSVMVVLLTFLEVLILLL